jgi:hypothetical protein
MDEHDKQSPDDDIQKNPISGACNGLACHGGILGTLLSLFLACFCFRRCFCASRRTKPALYHRAEVEMANGSRFSSYKDDYGDDDAEFGVLS